MSKVIVFNGAEPKRRQYSKSGCKECKRRKIKCDEGKPACWQCDRLKKSCVYPMRGERVRRASLKKLNWQQHQQHGLSAASESELAPKPTLTSTPTSSVGLHSTTLEQPSVAVPGPVPVPMPMAVSAEAPTSRPAKAQVHFTTTGGGDVPGVGRRLHGTPHFDSSPQTHQHTKGGSTHQEPSTTIINGKSMHGKYLSQPLQGEAAAAPSALPHPQTLPPLPRNHSNSTNGPTSLVPSSSSSLTHLLNTNSPSYSALQPQQTPTSSSTNIGVSPLPLEYDGFSKDDLNLLATDLNNIVSNIMFESKYEVQSDKSVSDFDIGSGTGASASPFPYGYGSQMLTPMANYQTYMVDPATGTTGPIGAGAGAGAGGAGVGSGTAADANAMANAIHDGARTTVGITPKAIPLDYIKINKPHEKLYLEEFYNEFSGIILPFNVYDEGTRSLINPARDILLTCAAKEKYLLAAILAQGAKTSFKKSGLQEDDRAYCHYLSKCLQLLGPALGKEEEEEEDPHKQQQQQHHHHQSHSLTSNIEAVLLTVLLLTSANASNTKQNWRAHLRGAKDLLLKHTYSVNARSRSSRMRSTPIFIFCKFWYISIEILAGLSSDYGGTLKGDDELDMLITSGDTYEIMVMKGFNLVREDGFNILFGYPNDCVPHLRDLIKVLNRRRSDKITSTDEYFRLISAFYEQGMRSYVSRDAIVNDVRVPTPGSLVDTFRSPDSSRPAYSVSWVDLSHQSYIIAAQITLLTKGFNMPSSSPRIQELVGRFTSMLSFLSSPDTPGIKFAVLMVQWPSLIIGLNCVEEEDKFLIMKLFRLSAQVGSGSAGFSLRRLHKVWRDGTDGAEDEDAGVDIMTY
ncbi:hypothetical protein CAAN1_32S00540 [[Candida] anglica]|uniref:Zn(2)-C6 fungal-type domain-containing protein n=1 Tax=[Candida] anglica TaxID=148631 RepID=A0ABP0EAG8_9ASCO